ncbi:MAG TPA: hypothetical protein VN228_15790, partial [Pyrinomonadaceae bacterium]|nr:hypothetical protein [Pyrinomonadaceae bacterium]
MKSPTHRPARLAALLTAALAAFAFAHAARAGQRAATLEDYRGRVHEAALELDELAGAERDAGWEAEVFGLVREALPRSERVEWAGGAVEVNNAWLHDALDAYEKAGDEARPEKLGELAARLVAL